MGLMTFRWRTTISMIIILLTVTACFQQVGDEAQGQQSSSLITSTFTPPVTSTPIATDKPTETATERPTAADLPIVSNPTETPTETPTEEPAVVAQAGGDDLGGDDTGQVDDPFSLTATQLVIDATARAALPLTQTAEAILGSITQTPTPTLTLAPGVVATTAPVLTGADCVHEVTARENMFRLSMYYGVSVADIATRNAVVNPNVIIIGQKLTIPNCGTTGNLPPPTSIPTQAITLNPLGTGGTDLGGTGTTAPTTTTGCVAQYTVQQYDSLFSLSVTYNVPVQSIANANGISNINLIDMGEVLCIPAQ